MYKYLAVDFDGTLLKRDLTVDANIIAYFKEIQEKGVMIICASGRNISQMQDTINLFNPGIYDTFIVSDNGATIHKYSKGEAILQQKLEFNKAEIDYLYSNFNEITKDYLMFCDGVCHFEKMSEKQKEISVKYKRRLKEGMVERGSKVVMLDEISFIEENYQAICEKVAKDFPTINVFRSVANLIEFTPQNATKGDALKVIFDANDFDKDKLIAFGDGENDIEMLKFANLGVAMQNSFKEVIAIADDVCGHHDTDAIYQYLKTGGYFE